MTNKKASPIKSYTDKTGRTMYMFRVYLGIDDLTGKAKNTTRRGFKTKKEAELALAKIKVQVSEGTYKSTRVETYKDIYDLWIVQYEKTVEESTFVKTLGYFKNHILPSMGDYRIEKITISACQKHYDAWAGKVTKARTIKSYAAKVLDFAIVHGYIATNPFTHVETKVKQAYVEPVSEEDENFYTKEDLRTFLECAEIHLNYKAYTLLRLISYTGMRKSEALALTWNDLNLKENELTINKAIGRGKNTQLYKKSTKTGKARTIKIDPNTIDILKEWKKQQKQHYFKLGFNTLQKEQLIFSNKDNTYIQPGQVQKWMYSVQNKYQLKHVSPHGLRHSHCSLLFEAGVSIKEVQDRLGHSDVKTTLDIYTHVTKKAKEGAIQKFVNYLEG